MNEEKIIFSQARDFGETFNVALKFLRQNFKLFIQALLLIAGPFVLIAGIAGAFYQSNAIGMFNLAKIGQSTSILSILDQFGWAYAIFIIAAIISNLALVATVYSFMLNYREKGPGNFTVADVSQTVVNNIGNVLSVFLVITLLFILIAVVIVGITIGIITASPALGVLLIFLLIIGVLMVFPPLMWQLSAVYLVKMSEDRGVFESYRRTRDVMKDNFWWTWLIIVCAVIVVGLVGMIFTLPQAAYQMVLMFSNLKGSGGETSVSFLVVATICTFCSSLLYSAISVISGFHYFSLAEKKDGMGLMERIDEIGTTPNNNVEQQY